MIEGHLVDKDEQKPLMIYAAIVGAIALICNGVTYKFDFKANSQKVKERAKLIDDHDQGMTSS